MECKSLSKTILFLLVTELIDTLWNVNENRLEKLCRFLFELIDTLWNVNKNTKEQRKSTTAELIDTLWNVNEQACENRKRTVRINRYIMECK